MNFDFSGVKMAADVARARFNEAGAPESYHNKVTTFEGAIRDILTRFEPIVSATSTDTSLSAQGIQKLRVQRLCQCWNAIEALAVSEYGDLEKIIRDTEAKAALLKPYLEGGDPVLKLLQAQEVRAALRPRINDSPGRRLVMLAYQKACESGNDALLCYAIESAPTAAPILDKETIKKGKAARARAENPQAVRDAELFKLLKETLDYCLHQAKKAVIDAGLGMVNFDWGRVEFVSKEGALYEVKLLSLRPIRSKYVDPEGLYKTTALKAQKAGLDVDEGFLNQDWAA